MHAMDVLDPHDSTANRHDDTLLIAQAAAEWLWLLDTDDRSARRPFTQWLTHSPHHVREILLMSLWDLLLCQLDVDDGIDLVDLSERRIR